MDPTKDAIADPVREQSCTLQDIGNWTDFATKDTDANYIRPYETRTHNTTNHITQINPSDIDYVTPGNAYKATESDYDWTNPQYAIDRDWTTTNAATATIPADCAGNKAILEVSFDAPRYVDKIKHYFSCTCRVIDRTHYNTC